ncbi:MAG: hypothetical protein N5P05_001434 [Chroococcopsis gigantea SAG 12.99]|jgi:hypothetical protein|nr:hypothetical protein [Chlorogloea purpurea SAG 13.99]MDV2999828.1 hypothetical protein [Chroococcopsis gigantea SAG 12.99]
MNQKSFINNELPQDTNPSYGTVVHQGISPVDNDGTLGGGDIDADSADADSVGEEAVGGTVSTPDQDIVDNIGRAVGLEIGDGEILRGGEIIDDRDNRHRWELDPESSEDYETRLS